MAGRIEELGLGFGGRWVETSSFSSSEGEGEEEEEEERKMTISGREKGGSS